MFVCSHFHNDLPLTVYPGVTAHPEGDHAHELVPVPHGPDQAAPAVPAAGVAPLRHCAQVRGAQRDAQLAEDTPTLVLGHKAGMERIRTFFYENLSVQQNTYLKSSFCSLVDRFVAVPLETVTPLCLSINLCHLSYGKSLL